MALVEEVKEEYRTSLADLHFNSKPLISMLTMLADDHEQHAPEIVKVIEAHINKSKPERKLPVLYLMDSIMKNLEKSSYGSLFARNIVHTFTSVFEQVDEKTRASMFKLRQTWTEVLPNAVLYRIDVRIKNFLDPAWPITAKEPEKAIHVNPKFLQANSEGERSSPEIFEDSPVEEMEEEEEEEGVDESIMRQKLIAKNRELLQLQEARVKLELAEAEERLKQQKKQGTKTHSKSSTVSSTKSVSPKSVPDVKPPEVPRPRPSDPRLRDPRLKNKVIPSSGKSSVKPSASAQSSMSGQTFQPLIPSTAYSASQPPPVIDPRLRMGMTSSYNPGHQMSGGMMYTHPTGMPTGIQTGQDFTGEVFNPEGAMFSDDNDSNSSRSSTSDSYPATSVSNVRDPRHRMEHNRNESNIKHKHSSSSSTDKHSKHLSSEHRDPRRHTDTGRGRNSKDRDTHGSSPRKSSSSSLVKHRSRSRERDNKAEIKQRELLMEAEKKRKEEFERKQQEEKERKRKEEERKREEMERKKKEEMERKKREEAERKRKEEAERKRKEEIERKKRMEIQKKREEKERQELLNRQLQEDRRREQEEERRRILEEAMLDLKSQKSTKLSSNKNKKVTDKVVKKKRTVKGKGNKDTESESSSQSPVKEEPDTGRRQRSARETEKRTSADKMDLYRAVKKQRLDTGSTVGESIEEHVMMADKDCHEEDMDLDSDSETADVPSKIQQDISDLFGVEDEDYRPVVQKSQLPLKSPSSKGWDQFKATHSDQYAYDIELKRQRQDSIVEQKSYEPEDEDLRVMRPDFQRQISGTEQIEVPKQLSMDQHAEILLTANKQLTKGMMSHDQYQELVKQLSELVEIQKLQEQNRRLSEEMNQPIASTSDSDLVNQISPRDPVRETREVRSPDKPLDPFKIPKKRVEVKIEEDERVNSELSRLYPESPLNRYGQNVDPFRDEIKRERPWNEGRDDRRPHADEFDRHGPQGRRADLFPSAGAGFDRPPEGPHGRPGDFPPRSQDGPHGRPGDFPPGLKDGPRGILGDFPPGPQDGPHGRPGDFPPRSQDGPRGILGDFPPQDGPRGILGDFPPRSQDRPHGRPVDFPPGPQDAPRGILGDFPPGSQDGPHGRPGDFPPGRQDGPHGRPADFPPGRQDVPHGRPGDFPPGPQDVPHGRPGDFPLGRPGDFPLGPQDGPHGRPVDFPPRSFDGPHGRPGNFPPEPHGFRGEGDVEKTQRRCLLKSPPREFDGPPEVRSPTRPIREGQEWRNDRDEEMNWSGKGRGGYRGRGNGRPGRDFDRREDEREFFDGPQDRAILPDDRDWRDRQADDRIEHDNNSPRDFDGRGPRDGPPRDRFPDNRSGPDRFRDERNDPRDQDFPHDSRRGRGIGRHGTRDAPHWKDQGRDIKKEPDTWGGGSPNWDDGPDDRRGPNARDNVKDRTRHGNERGQPDMIKEQYLRPGPAIRDEPRGLLPTPKEPQMESDRPPRDGPRSRRDRMDQDDKFRPGNDHNKDGPKFRQGNDQNNDDPKFRSGNDSNKDGPKFRQGKDNNKDGSKFRQGKDNNKEGFKFRQGKDKNKDGPKFHQGKDHNKEGAGETSGQSSRQGRRGKKFDGPRMGEVQDTPQLESYIDKFGDPRFRCFADVGPQVIEEVAIGKRNFEIKVGGPPRKIKWHKGPPIEMYADPTKRAILIDNNVVYRFGEKVKDVNVRGQNVPLFYHGPPLDLWIEGQLYEVRVDAPPKYIHINGKKHKIKIDGRDMMILIDNEEKGRFGGEPRFIIVEDVRLELRFEPPPRHILIDGNSCELQLNMQQPCVNIKGVLHGIRFDGPPRDIIINEKLYQIHTDHAVKVRVGNRYYYVSLGGPCHELIIDGKWYEVNFSNNQSPPIPPKEISIGRQILTVRLPGPPPEVKILPEIAQEPRPLPPGMVPPGMMMPGPGPPRMLGPGPPIMPGLGPPSLLDLRPPGPLGMPPDMMMQGPGPRGMPPPGMLMGPLPGQMMVPPGPMPGMGPPGMSAPPMPPISSMNLPNSGAPPMTGPNRMPGMGGPPSLLSINTTGSQPSGGMPNILSSLFPPVPSTTSSAPIDIGSLFAKLVNTGIIKKEPEVKAPSTSPPPTSQAPTVHSEFPDAVVAKRKPVLKKEKFADIPDMTEMNPPDMKSLPVGMIQRLYSGLQCTSCGQRFATENGEKTEQYRQHLDWHFRQNRKGKDDTKVTQCRKWYYGIEDWILYEEVADGEDTGKSNFFEQQQQQQQPLDTTPTPSTNTLSLMVPEGVSIIKCPAATGNDDEDMCNICNEQFEQYWDEELEEWHLRDAISVNKKTYHPICYEDHTDASEGTPSPSVLNVTEPGFRSKRSLLYEDDEASQDVPESQTLTFDEDRVIPTVKEEPMESTPEPDDVEADNVEAEVPVTVKTEPVVKTEPIEESMSDPAPDTQIPFLAVVKDEPNSDSIPFLTDTSAENKTDSIPFLADPNVERKTDSIPFLTDTDVANKTDAIPFLTDTNVQNKTDSIPFLTDANVQNKTDSIPFLTDANVQNKTDSIPCLTDANVQNKTDSIPFLTDTNVASKSESIPFLTDIKVEPDTSSMEVDTPVVSEQSSKVSEQSLEEPSVEESSGESIQVPIKQEPSEVVQEDSGETEADIEVDAAPVNQEELEEERTLEHVDEPRVNMDTSESNIPVTERLGTEDGDKDTEPVATESFHENVKPTLELSGEFEKEDEIENAVSEDGKTDIEDEHQHEQSSSCPISTVLSSSSVHVDSPAELSDIHVETSNNYLAAPEQSGLTELQHSPTYSMLNKVKLSVPQEPLDISAEVLEIESNASTPTRDELPSPDCLDS